MDRGVVLVLCVCVSGNTFWCVSSTVSLFLLSQQTRALSENSAVYSTVRLPTRPPAILFVTVFASFFRLHFWPILFAPSSARLLSVRRRVLFASIHSALFVSIRRTIRFSPLSTSCYFGLSLFIHQHRYPASMLAITRRFTVWVCQEREGSLCCSSQLTRPTGALSLYAESVCESVCDRTFRLLALYSGICGSKNFAFDFLNFFVICFVCIFYLFYLLLYARHLTCSSTQANLVM